MEIGGWLRSLGLQQYEAAFRENEIDETVLPSLTAEDLKDLGVELVGHRRKLLDAIAALRPQPSTPASVSDATADGEKPVSEFAERRQVTVMFSDLVGSTALSARMDPEDLREIISAYQKCVTETVRRFGGFVAKYMGDGVLIYFGYPQAHEDDAEQAVRAGIELVAAVKKLQSHARLQTRVGVATGLVIVGDIIGSGEAHERGIVGETPNLAARLQAIAEPDQVVIGDATRRLIGTFFELKETEPRDLKGFGLVSAWSVLRESGIEGRFEALHGTSYSELVGREPERTLLLQHWRRAQDGNGQIVLLSGEAGIGKSRLLAALVEGIASNPYTRLSYFCSPRHGESAFRPIIDQLRRAAGFASADTPKAKLDKLDALMAATDISLESRALIADLVSVPNDGRYPELTLDPQQQRQRTFQALHAQLNSLALKQPVLMIFEDVHWIDPTSLEVLSRTIERIGHIPVMLVITYRPEFNPPWLEQPGVTTVVLNRLTAREVTAIIERLVGARRLSADVMAGIAERTDGVPLFVEEMTAAVLEAESESTALRTVAVVPSAALSIPASLHISLMARLDRLGTAKEVAQIGAAIGREFSHLLLASVLGHTQLDVEWAVHRLVQTGLVIPRGTRPDTTYLFKHALVQDAAYSTLLRGPRRALHARIAEALERRFVEIAESQPEILAHHCTEAGLIGKGASLWGKAGLRSLARSALLEGAAQLTRALHLISTLPTTPALRREQIKFQVALANAMMHTKGYAADETKASVDRARMFIERAEALGEGSEDPLLLFSVLYGSWVASFVGFNGDICCVLASQFLALANKKEDTATRMIGHRLMGSSLLLAGDIAEAKLHYDRGIALYNPVQHRPLAMRFGQDVEVSILSFRSLALWLLGYPETALSDTDRALRDARASGHAPTLLFALSHVPLTCIHCGEYAAANAQADEGVALAEEKGTLLWKAAGTIFKGLILALNGSAQNAVELIATGISATRWTGATLWMPLNFSYLAMAHAELDHFDDAWRCIGDAMSTAETTKSAWCQAETDRIAGEIALKSPEPDAVKAQAYFERALGVARAQQAKSWELRAALSMARLWRYQGKPDEARELLAPVYGWFTEGFDTLDLKQAKALLDDLA